MYPVKDHGLYVMPSPEVDWLTMDCASCSGLGALGVYEPPPPWKIGVAIGLTAAIIGSVIYFSDKARAR